MTRREVMEMGDAIAILLKVAEIILEEMKKKHG
jgi:hypothetical protein